MKRNFIRTLVIVVVVVLSLLWGAARASAPNADGIIHISPLIKSEYAPASLSETRPIFLASGSGQGVNVYVVDTGIRTTHQEFDGRAVIVYEAYAVDKYPECQGIGHPEDRFGHGTSVASVVGGNTVGVARDVNLFAVTVFDCYGSAMPNDVLEAVDWVIENHQKPAVVNMSFSVYQIYEAYIGQAKYTELDMAVDALVEAGITVVVAAGNSATDAMWESPSRAIGAITVGAVTLDNRKPVFSNYGSLVDMYAPGVFIRTASPVSDSAYDIYSGTSLSAPYVTGLAALYLEDHPQATPQEVREWLVENTHDGLVVSDEPAHVIDPNRSVLDEPIVLTYDRMIYMPLLRTVRMAYLPPPERGGDGLLP